MMIQAFYTGISGVKAHQTAIDVVADNLANTSTLGFRGYSSEFSSLFEKSVVGPSDRNAGVGLGTSVNAITMDNNSGVIQLSERNTDLAIMGDGWFGIQGEGAPIYTRDGSFTFDRERDLVTADGYYVLGTMGTNINNGVLTQQLSEVGLGNVATQEKLRFPNELTYPVSPTTEAKFFGNLGLDDTTRVISSKAIDAQSNTNNIRLEFNKVVPQVSPGTQWNVVATAQSAGVQTFYNEQTGETTYLPDEIYDTQSGVVSFDDSGVIVSNTLSTINNNGTPVNINLGTGYEGLISMNNPFSGSSTSDGVKSGELYGYEINKNGQIIATFSNGMQSSIGSVAVYHFQNDKGLERINGSRFSESTNSGRPIFFQDANGNNILGTDLSNFKLEGSNVRMEVALTEIIIMQRSYDANSKCITTADQMLQKALNMSAK
ncbi:MAG TPA: flagellar hook-basal body complex protein [Sulfurimonas sp.]|jgi:flagellar hook protein FlgE|uniref:flagellar hook protein FlgE n=1 Tax=Sulfurimonas sp. TaxID=2022749 RepID=UPI002B8BCABA|nr:flagellar hook-basal body complex protein [Sulfurimonas sp.]HUH42163.1 flagellar hook-basal body complex protein [Sulfurimonas sp.]